MKNCRRLQKIINQINPGLGWTVTRVVEKDPSKSWFKLPGKPVGKWEVELYRKQRAWDSDSNFVVPKAHKLWQSAPVHGTYLYTFYNHFQQQLAPSPAGDPQPLRTQISRAIGSKGWVWALQSPPRNKIATIKIKLWLLWKLFITL